MFLGGHITGSGKKAITSLLSAFLVLCLIGFQANAAAPEAGTDITNISSATYFNALSGEDENITSNLVVATVNAVPDYTLSGDITLVRAPDDLVTFTYTVTNTGNTNLTVTPDLSPFTGDFAIGLVTLAHDENLDGVIQPTEIIDGTTTISLPLGAASNFLVYGHVSELALAGEQASANLGFTALETPAVLSAAATVVIDTPNVDINKAVSVDSAFAGDLLTYTLSMENASLLPLLPSSVYGSDIVTLDGVVSEVIILRDTFPEETTFHQFEATLDFQPVFHIRGDDEYTFTTTQPVDASTIDAVAFLLNDPLAPGAFREVSFTVLIDPETVETSLVNEALTPLPQSNGAVISVSSNTVSTVIAAPAAGEGTITVYEDDGFSSPASVINFDTPFYVEVASRNCDLTSAVDTISVVLEIQPTGDRETVTAVETGPVSGIFRVGPLTASAGQAVNVDDGVLNAEEDARLTVRPQCDPAISSEVPVETVGFVFNSVTNDPVAGVTVELLDASGNIVATSVTDSVGKYTLIIPVDGNYSVQISNISEFSAPSTITVFDGFDRTIDQNGSFGQIFAAASDGIRIDFDVPVDPVTISTLFLSKSSERDVVSPGQVVPYTIELRNSALSPLQQITVLDALPPGFSYVPGSARFDEVAITDPSGADTASLSFSDLTLAPLATGRLSYAVRVGPNAGDGIRVNRAQATGSLGGSIAITSNTAQASVRVDRNRSVFSSEGVILGKVFLDCNEDNIQNGDHEPGIPGVQIFTQEGTIVVTDASGRFSLPRLRAQTHVLDIYETTLPSGAVVKSTRVLDAGKGGSRFVPLKAGEVRSEDFAVSACSADILTDVMNRKEKYANEKKKKELQALRFDKVERDGFSDVHEKSVSGAQSAAAVISDGSDLDNTGLDTLAVQKVAATRDLYKELPTYTDETGFIDLVDGQVLDADTVTVRVKGSKAGVLKLSVNGVEISEDRKGQFVRDRRKGGLQAVEFVAVKFQPGENKVSVILVDPFGNERGRNDIMIKAPGEPERILVEAPESVPANAQEPFEVRLVLVDRNNIPVSRPAEVTLSAMEGEWLARDIRDTEPGIQTLLDNGNLTVQFKPSGLVGTQELQIKSAYGVITKPVRFVADTKKPPVVVGFIEGAYAFGENQSSLEGLLEEDDLSIFEDTQEGINGEFFVKGGVGKNILLTMRYDSERDDRDRLFRDVEPDEFYPVYGDQSEIGFDAQSRGELFVKLEKDLSYILYGDVRYNAEVSAFQLGSFQRSLEGGKAHFEKDRLSVNLYAGETDTSQQIVEIPAIGISGPYALEFSNVVENSEVVEILVRDRDQPSRIISTRSLVRFADYTLDYFARTIIFSAPVESVDGNLNPVSIRVTFETTEGDGEKYWIYGGETRLDVSENVAVGYRELRADAPGLAESGQNDKRTVRAAYAEATFEGGGLVQLEVAQTTSEELDETGPAPVVQEKTGEAVRLSYTKNTENSSVSARIGYTDEEFDAPGANQSAGTLEARVQARKTLSEKTSVTAEGLYSEDHIDDEQRYGVVARVEKRLGDNISGRIGARYVSTDGVAENDPETSDDLVSAIAGASWTPGFLQGANFDAEVEQSLNDSNHFRFKLGADYTVSPKLRAYLLSEWASSDRGAFAIGESTTSNTAVRGGIEYTLTDEVKGFSEYRANQGTFDAGVANGLTVSWSASEQLNLRARVEHVEALTEVYQGNTAAAVGATWEPPEGDSVIAADIEYALSASDTESIYISNTIGHKVGDTTLLARNRYAITEESEGNRIRDRLRVGAAYRPSGNDKLNALAWYEYGVESDANIREESHIWSVGAEYKPNDSTRIRPRYAGQDYSYKTDSFEDQSTLHMAQLGADKDVLDWFNLGVNLSLFADEGFTEWNAGAGVEGSFLVADNVLLGVGYNYATLREDNFRDLYQDGFFLRLRVKFDQDSWNIFND